VGGVAFPSLRCSCLLSQWRLNGEKHCDIFWLRGAFFIFVFSQLPLPSDANSNSGEGMTKGGCVGHGEGGGDRCLIMSGKEASQPRTKELCPIPARRFPRL